MMTSVDVSNYIGAYDYDVPNHRRMCGLYFPPREFPPPSNADSGGNSDTFRRLKTYIEAVSDAEQSPVICSGAERDTIKFLHAKRTSLAGGRHAHFHSY